MKHILTFFAFVFVITYAKAQVGINTDTPDPKSILDIQSTDKGVLVPRMTEAQRDAIDPAPNGLMVYNLTSKSLSLRIEGQWVDLNNVVSIPQKQFALVDYAQIDLPEGGGTAEAESNVKFTRIAVAPNSLMFDSGANLVTVGGSGTVNRITFNQAGKYLIRISGKFTKKTNGSDGAAYNRNLRGRLILKKNDCSPTTTNNEFLDTWFHLSNGTNAANDKINYAIVDMAAGDFICLNAKKDIMSTTASATGLGRFNNVLIEVEKLAAPTPVQPLIVAFTATDPTYNGSSVINSQGVGYNGETVPSNNIVVQVNVSQLATGGGSNAWSLSASHPGSGLTYSGSGTFTTTGVQNITLTSNTPTIPGTFYGLASMTLSGAPFTNTKVIQPRIDIKSIPASQTAVVEVSFAGRTWMDRNLGARRVAVSATDALSYGNYYQWGRQGDGHEITVHNGVMTSSARGFHDITAVLATSDIPGHPNHIVNSNMPYDWRDNNNNNRWATGANNPCPTGYRIPTITELDNARAAFTTQNRNGAFGSALKLPSPGMRSQNDGLLFSPGSGYYWSSTPVASRSAQYLFFASTEANTTSYERAMGFPVRCIKN